MVYLSGGTMMKGTMVIDVNTRLSDALNRSDKEFVVVSDYEDTPNIINKHHIIKLIELQESGLQSHDLDLLPSGTDR
jgi:hypothetical protein